MIRTKPFNVRMDAATRYKLEQLCKQQDLTGAQLIRTLIKDRWLSLHENQPRCATGAHCCMPAVYLNNQGAALATKENPPEESAAAKATAPLFPQEPPPVEHWRPEAS